MAPLQMKPDAYEANLALERDWERLFRQLTRNWDFAMKYSIIAGFFLATMASSHADPNPTRQDIEHLCLRPSDVKSHVLIEGDGQADGGVIIRLLGLHLNGSARFTKEEWNGVQAALPSTDVA